MIDHVKRIREVVLSELSKVKLSDKIGYALSSGPGVVIGPQGNPAIGWTLTLTLKHEKLIGEPDMGASMPIFDSMPTDDTFRTAVGFLLDQMRQQRFAQENPEIVAQAIKQAQEATDQPQQENGSPVPAGLTKGKMEMREVPRTPQAKPKPRKEVAGTESETASGLKVVDRRRSRT